MSAPKIPACTPDGVVNSFFEIRHERVGLIEQRQDAEFAIIEQSFQRHFRTRNEALDAQRIELGLSRDLDFSRGKELRDLSDGNAKLCCVICADDALACREA